LPNGKNIGIKEFAHKIYGKERRIIGGYNPNRAKMAAKHFEGKLNKKIERIESFFNSRLNSSRWSEQKQVHDKCLKVLGTTRFRNAVRIEIGGESGKLSLLVSKDEEALQKYTHTLGKSFLMTNRDDLTPLKVVWAYRQQYMVEHAFKLLKNPLFLSIRPMYAYTDPA
jgi:transposase